MLCVMCANITLAKVYIPLDGLRWTALHFFILRFVHRSDLISRDWLRER